MKRLILLSVVILLSVALDAAGTSFESPAIAQTSEESTIEALQTTVALQGDQIATLQSEVDALNGSVALLTSNVATMLAGSSESTSGQADQPTPTAEPESFEIAGRLTIINTSPRNPAFTAFYSSSAGKEICTGSGGFDDIERGAQVVVSNGNGQTIGTTTLGYGELDVGCRFVFTVEVPRSDFYAFTIGQRGGPTFSFEELEQLDWEVPLTLS